MKSQLALALTIALALQAGAAEAITWNVQGFVKDPRGVGIGGVTVDLFDPVANAKATALQNITLANGQFNALFTPGNAATTLFYVDFAPTRGAGHAALQLKDVRVTAPATQMGSVVLADAVSVQVNVFDNTGILPEPNVDLDVYDATTGSKLYTPAATTGAGGNVSVDLPPGLYDLLLTPAPAGPLGPAALRSKRITVATVLNVNLTAGSPVTGSVTDPLGLPIDRAALGISDAATRADVATRYTSRAGVISLWLPAGTYDVDVEPPAGTDLLPARLAAVSVPGAAWAVQLARGLALTGRVVDGGGAPAWLASLQVENAATGVNLNLARARVDTTGAFRIVVPPGAWNLTVQPPPASRLFAKTLTGIVVGASAVDVGTVVLEAGAVMTGRVTGAGQPVPDVNLIVSDARTGAVIATADDHSDWNGQFRVVLPTGTFDLAFQPPRGTAWQSAERRAVVVSTDMTLAPDVVLQAGIGLGATIRGQGAGALEGASLRLLDPLTAEEVPLPHRTSTSLGTVSTQAPAGSFVAQVLPPPGTDWLPLQVGAVGVGPGATNLGTLTLQRGALLDGFVKTAATLQGVADVNVNLFDPATGLQRFTARDHSDFSGHYVVAAAPGLQDVEYLPPSGNRLHPAALSGVTLAPGGTTLPDVLLAEGLVLSGRTVDATTSAPIASVNLDVLAATPILTAHDHSAFDGAFETVVPSGTYDLLFVPMITSPYVATRLPGTSVTSDTDVGDVLLRAGFPVGGHVRAPGGAGVAGVVVSARTTAGGAVIELTRNVTDASGLVDWMVLPPGSADLTFTPPPGSGLRAKTQTFNIVAESHALFDVTLVAAPRVTGVAPPSGTTRGGDVVTITGTDLAGTPAVLFGGIALTNVTVTSPTTLTGMTPLHPQGVADVEVTFPGDPTQVLPAAFTFVEPAPALLLRVARVRAGAIPTPDLALTWTGAAAPFTAFRATVPGAWRSAAPPTSALTLALPGEVGLEPLTFFVVQ